jgi:hypothetical protein
LVSSSVLEYVFGESHCSATILRIAVDDQLRDAALRELMQARDLVHDPFLAFREVLRAEEHERVAVADTRAAPFAGRRSIARSKSGRTFAIASSIFA